MLYALDLGNKQVKAKSAKIERVLPSYFIESSLYGNRSFFGGLTTQKDVKDFESVNDKGITYVWGTDLDLSADVTDCSGFGMERYQSREFSLLVDFTLAELAIFDAAEGETITVNVVAGLPTDDFLNPKIKEQVISVIKGKHLVTVDGTTLTIIVDKLLLLPQPLGTAYNLALDDDGMPLENNPLENIDFGLVDAGGGTILIDAFRDLKMDYDKRVQTNNGSYALFRKIVNKLNEVDISINEYELENAIRKTDGIWSPDGVRKIDLNPTIEEEAKLYTRRLATTVRTAYKGFSSAAKYIFTGGTANLLDEDELELSWPGKWIVVEDAELSNVRGSFKYAKKNGLDKDK